MSVDGIPPSVDGIPPSVDGIPPSVDGIPPSVDGISPSVDGIPPSVVYCHITLFNFFLDPDPGGRKVKYWQTTIELPLRKKYFFSIRSKQMNRLIEAK